jgi:hypothetical protein
VFPPWFGTASCSSQQIAAPAAQMSCGSQPPSHFLDFGVRYEASIGAHLCPCVQPDLDPDLKCCYGGWLSSLAHAAAHTAKALAQGCRIRAIGLVLRWMYLEEKAMGKQCIVVR